MSSLDPLHKHDQCAYINNSGEPLDLAMLALHHGSFCLLNTMIAKEVGDCWASSWPLRQLAATTVMSILLAVVVGDGDDEQVAVVVVVVVSTFCTRLSGSFRLATAGARVQAVEEVKSQATGYFSRRRTPFMQYVWHTKPLEG